MHFILNKISIHALYLGAFTLPIYQTINHWFFGIFIGAGIVSMVSNKNCLSEFKIHFRYILVFSGLFFVLRLFTLLYTPDMNLGIKELTRALPFLLYPLAILSIKCHEQFDYNKFERKLFWALSVGCIVTAIICWGNIILTLESNPLPKNQLFGWKKSGTYLTELLDLHPPYLGILIFGSIVFMFKESYYNTRLGKKTKFMIYFMILFLLLFLFNLTARNSMFFLAISSLVFFIYNRQWKFVTLMFVLFSITVVAIIYHPSQYYRLKMYHMLGLSDKDDLEDQRFKRLEASYNVFKTNPIFGVGLGDDIDMKVEEYRKMDDKVAVQERFNSHNQFFEYLAAYGLVGGLLFIFVLVSFICFLIKHKYYFYLLLFLNVVFATLTESLFERALGIQYYALIVSLALLKFYTSKDNKSKSGINEN